MSKPSDLEHRIREEVLSRLDLQSRDRQLGVLTQAAFIQQSQRHLSSAHLASLPAALLFADIDDFREVNEAYGLETGDRVIAGVAASIRGAVGSSGVVGRWGGEEFAILLPRMNQEQAVSVAEEIRQGIQDCAFESIEHDQVRATVSLGVALFPRDGSELVVLIERADRACVEAKARGKNRVQVYSKPFGPSSMHEQIERLFDEVLAKVEAALPPEERQRLLDAIVADALGLGPLEPLLADPSVTEIMVDGHERVYVERNGELQDVPSDFRDDEHLMDVIRRITDPLGLRLDARQPYLDAPLPDGSRINVVIAPISLVGPALTIRKFSTRPLTLEELLRFGVLSEDMVTFLQACIRARLNIAVAGGTGSGKTTFLNVLCGMIPAGERVVTVENASELRLPAGIQHLVSLESRTPNWEGKGEVTMRDLVVNALRMRPDRIVVGEVRAGEALEILQAMNTGHDGMMFSIHANDPRDVLARLETMAMMANPSLPLRNLRQYIASAINVITCQERMRDGTRKIVKVTEVVGMQGDVLVLQDLFEYRQTGFDDGRIAGVHTATGIIPKHLSSIRDAGIDLPMDVFVPR